MSLSLLRTKLKWLGSLDTIYLPFSPFYHRPLCLLAVYPHRFWLMQSNNKMNRHLPPHWIKVTNWISLEIFFFNFWFYISEQWENWNQTTNVFCCNFQAVLCIHFDLINLKERSMKFIVASSNNAQKYIVFDVRACIAVA